MRGLRRTDSRRQSTGEAPRSKEPDHTAADVSPAAGQAPRSGASTDTDNGAVKTTKGHTFPIAAFIAGVALIAAIAAIPSRGALIGFLLGAAGVVIGLVGWQHGGRGGRLCYTGAGILCVIALIILVTNATSVGGSSSADRGLPSPVVSTPTLTKSNNAPKPTSATPTPKVSTPTPSGQAAHLAKKASYKPMIAKLATARGNGRYFAAGHVNVRLDSILGDHALLTVSTKSDACNINPSVGEILIIGVPSDGYYQVTLLSVSRNKFATIRVRQVHVAIDPGGSSYICPLS